MTEVGAATGVAAFTVDDVDGSATGTFGVTPGAGWWVAGPLLASTIATAAAPMASTPAKLATNER